MDKSEALFLADELEAPLGTVIGAELYRRAAEKLRRLHADAERYRASCHERSYRPHAPDCKKNNAITALRAALAQQDEPKGGGNLPPPLQAEPVQEPDLSRCPQCGGIADNGHDRSIPPNPYLCTKCMAEMPQPSYNVTVVDDAHPNGIPLEQWQNKPVQEPVDFVSLLREADEIVRGKPTWKRFIDGTPLSNDIAVWMTVFAQDVARRAAPPQRKPLSLTDLQEALVLTNLIDRDAIDDSEEYDEGSTLAQIDALYRIIIKERV